MNQQIRSIIFGVAGLLVLAGAILFLTHWAVAPYLFAVGAAGIAVCYLTLPVKDLDFRRRRLHRFNVFAGLLMIVSSRLYVQQPYRVDPLLERSRYLTGIYRFRYS